MFNITAKITNTLQFSHTGYTLKMMFAGKQVMNLHYYYYYYNYTHYTTCYLCISLCTDTTKIIIMTGIVATVTGIIILYYIKIYDEDYYSYPIQAVDQGENGILVFLE